MLKELRWAGVLNPSPARRGGRHSNLNMKNPYRYFAAISIALFLLSVVASSPVAAQKIKVLVITGGHGFEHGPFYDVFNAQKNIYL